MHVITLQLDPVHFTHASQTREMYVHNEMYCIFVVCSYLCTYGIYIKRTVCS